MLGGLLLAAGVVLYLLGKGGPKLSDADSIRQTVEQARVAAEKHNLGEIMDCVSQTYDDGNYKWDSLRTTIAFGLRQYPSFESSISLGEIQIQGDIATVDADVKATGTSQGGDRLPYEATLKLTFVREKTRRALLFEGTKWRVSRIGGMGDMVNRFGMGM